MLSYGKANRIQTYGTNSFIQFQLDVLCFISVLKNFKLYMFRVGRAVVQWLRHCATNRKVAGSIPDGVRIFH
jgi:aspartate/tyrosine/aromatic aminotransferase